jgi:hypothetical protein
MGVSETRLAVTFARAPLRNTRCTEARSRLSVRIVPPEASKLSTSEPVKCSTRSRSWIIRSCTTPTSRLRKLKVDRR